MRCDRCGKATNILFHACNYELCPKCAKLLYIASLPLGERTRLHRERAEKYARQEVA